MNDRNLRTMKSCLWNAFANYDPQEDMHMWAIYEGVARLGRISRQQWRDVKARKKHECTRGCKIKNGHVYFQMQLGGGWGYDLKICAGCMAMILYFQQTYNLPPYFHTHWDNSKNEPVRETEKKM